MCYLFVADNKCILHFIFFVNQIWYVCTFQGSCIKDVFDDAQKNYAIIQEKGHALLDQALARLMTNSQDKGSQATAVWLHSLVFLLKKLSLNIFLLFYQWAVFNSVDATRDGVALVPAEAVEHLVAAGMPVAVQHFEKLVLAT